MIVVWYLLGLFILLIVAGVIAMAIAIPVAKRWRRRMKETGLRGYYDADGNWIGISQPQSRPADPPYPPPPPPGTFDGK